MAKNTLVEILVKIESDKKIQNLFKLNKFTKNIEFIKQAPWGNSDYLTDSDVVHLKYHLSCNYGIEPTVNILQEVILILAARQAYHPLKNYLDSLVWDGISRLNQWLQRICHVPDNSYTQDVGTKVLTGAVARIYDPGTKFDYMMILEGDQGIGKSTLFNILAGQWYLDTHLSTHENKKDIIDMMRTAWIVEISDLAGFKKNDVEFLKSFISRKVDRVRMAYARNSEDFPRQCIFVGTHNPSGDNQYLRDDTGNRRFWPVECVGAIDLELAKQWRDQLWAEAVVQYKKGAILYLDQISSLEILNVIHEQREFDSPVVDLIDNYLIGKNIIKFQDILTDVFKMDLGRANAMDMRGKCTVIGIHMRKLQWIKGNNKKRGYYFRPGHEHDEVVEPTVEELWEEEA